MDTPADTKLTAHLREASHGKKIHYATGTSRGLAVDTENPSTTALPLTATSKPHPENARKLSDDSSSTRSTKDNALPSLVI
jgi:hypothetical protein